MFTSLPVGFRGPTYVVAAIIGVAALFGMVVFRPAAPHRADRRFPS
jgi:hypothetical protein